MMKQVIDLNCINIVKCCGECLGTVQSHTSLLSEETAGRKEQNSEHKVDLFISISLLPVACSILGFSVARTNCLSFYFL